MQCTDIVTAQFVCGVTSVFVANCWLVRTGRGSANRCVTRRSVLYMKDGAVCEGWSYLFRCSVLAEGPNNASMMAQQTTLFGTVLFGTVVKRDDFSRACLVLTTTLDTIYAVVEALWTLCVINNFLPAKQGGGFGKLRKTYGSKKLSAFTDIL